MFILNVEGCKLSFKNKIKPPRGGLNSLKLLSFVV
jgi:hypothetical protein